MFFWEAVARGVIPELVGCWFEPCSIGLSCYVLGQDTSPTSSYLTVFMLLLLEKRMAQENHGQSENKFGSNMGPWGTPEFWIPEVISKTCVWTEERLFGPQTADLMLWQSLNSYWPKIIIWYLKPKSQLTLNTPDSVSVNACNLFCLFIHLNLPDVFFPPNR